MSAVATPELPPHAPQESVWRKILGPFYVTGIFWYRFHRWGVAVLPPWLIGATIFVFTSFFWIALRNIRAAVASNLEAVLGPCGWWQRQLRIFRTLHTYAWCLSERYENLNGDRKPTVTIRGEEHWRQAISDPHGFILLTAHFGSWEAGSFLPSALTGRKVHVVREGETDPKAQEFIRSLIESQGDGGYVTHFADHDPRLGMKLLDALREGHIVALQGDRPRSWGRPIEARLFGRPFPLPAGPATLARAAEAPLVPVFVRRAGRLTYECEVRPAIRVDRDGDRDEAMRRAVDAFLVELEGAIRSCPHQWFCFRKLW